jgi:hypothetical protein
MKGRRQSADARPRNVQGVGKMYRRDACSTRIRNTGGTPAPLSTEDKSADGMAEFLLCGVRKSEGRRPIF